MTGQPAPIKVGELLNLAEADYLYGVGAIRLRVTEVAARQNLPGWIEVDGVEIRWDSERGDTRTVFVREAALDRASVRRSG